MLTRRRAGAGAALAVVLVVALGPFATQRAPRGGGDAAAPEEQLARGRHLVGHVLACATCHGSDLAGGLVDGPPGRPAAWAPGLGPDGPAGAYDDEDWERALRQGVAPDGRRLRGMPTERWAALSVADLDAVVAALRQVGSRPRPMPEGTDVTAWPVLDAPRSGPIPDQVLTAPDAAYGEYLATIAGCHDCHGVDLQGGEAVLAPLAGPDIAPDAALVSWTGAEFARAVVAGVRPDGTSLHPAHPSAAYAGLELTELDALWSHVRDHPVGGVADADPREPR